MNFSLWLPILVALTGFIGNMLSTDGGGNFLARWGVTWAIPKGAVTAGILLAGLAHSIFAGVQGGLGWEAAAAAGAMTSIEALFGAMASKHLTGRDDSGPPKGPPAVIAIVGAILLAGSLSACAALQRVTPYLPTPDQLLCLEVEADKGTPAVAIVTKCGFAGDALAFVESFLLSHHRAKAMRRQAAEDTSVPILVTPADAGAPDASGKDSGK